MENTTQHRNSSLQQDVMYVLLKIRARNSNPIPFTAIFSILNKGRSREVERPNLRISCRTLVERRLLLKYRDPRTLKVAYTLSEIGIELAETIRKGREDE
ncbi:chromosome segregation protein ParM [Proteus vulgaris]|uniref:Chromosome segregation protein ParM n=1 Tax=Morganella morganii TaxID=582 RepID=A0AAE4FF76_MORMO|nr:MULTISPECIES: chromosome segregation protein ParM [Morganellaceae]MDS0789313.1 chromosome segregation protein ParM [Proteus vulgaris]MDS0899926.1 chromosome segregation protein ParM [Morganella morganii]